MPNGASVKVSSLIRRRNVGFICLLPDETIRCALENGVEISDTPEEAKAFLSEEGGDWTDEEKAGSRVYKIISEVV